MNGADNEIVIQDNYNYNCILYDPRWDNDSTKSTKKPISQACWKSIHEDDVSYGQ